MNQSDLEVATIKENIRHNEKAIDKLGRDLREFRQDVKTDISSVKQELGKVKKNTDNLVWKLVLALACSAILDILLNKFIVS